jgi:outer membrane translocation and assembly module TamA
MRYSLTLILVFICSYFSAQKVNLTIQGINKKTIQINSSSYLNSKEIVNEKWVSLIEDGFLSASIDSIIIKDSITHIAHLFKGQKFNYASVTTNIPDEFKSQMGITEKLFKKQHFSPIKLKNIISKILNFCSNNGHPFAAIDLEINEIKSDNINLHLNLKVGPRITIDKIILTKEVSSQKELIQQIIDININDDFNDNKIKNISSRIKETTYFSELKPAEYEIINNKLSLYLYVKNKSAKYINGIIGIQPQKDEAISFTGDANFKFENAFKIGETLEFSWKKMYAQSQSLNANISFPYLFKSSFGVFNIVTMMKKDSSFFNLNNKFGSSFSFSKRKKISFYYQYINSNSLQTNNNNFKSTELNAIGISYEIDNLDYRFNPRKGLYTNGDFKLGNKNINEQNDTLNSSLKSLDYQLFLEFNNFFKLGNNSTIKLGGKFYTIINPYIFENELLRIGGNSNLRGFDEQSIWVSSYAIGVIEYRFLLEQNSNLFCFLNYAWTESNTSLNYTRDNPYSLGVGINFETKPGIFSLSYALGSQQDNPLLFKTAKIHFGFINFF